MIKVGLEVHFHPATSSKLFCRCPTSEESVCEICAAHPGAKPLEPNKTALLKTILVAKALRCKVSPQITFLRKHYFYPDLPAGFQRTSTPVGTQGSLEGIRIREVHVEEDAGRYDLKKGTVDYSRAGHPLIEIVTEPDICSAREAEKFIRSLRDLLECFGVWSDKTLRTDINISAGDGKKIEVKEVSTIKGIIRAIEYEKEILQKRSYLTEVTKHYDEKKGITVPLREKESAVEYRYIPDPDIPSIDLVPLFPLVDVDSVFRIKERMEREGIPSKLIRTIMVSGLAVFYSRLSEYTPPLKAAQWISSSLIGELKRENASIEHAELHEIARLLIQQEKGQISKVQFTRALRRMLKGEKPSTTGLLSYSEVKEVALKVVRSEQKAVDKLMKGKKSVLHYLIGQVIKTSGGKATHKQAEQAILELIPVDLSKKLD